MSDFNDQHSEPDSNNKPLDSKVAAIPNIELLDFIDRQIEDTEKELECPVCFNVATSPIYRYGCSSWKFEFGSIIFRF